MLVSERAYQYAKNLKAESPDQYEQLKANLDEAVVTLRKMLRDNTLTRTRVELIFTDETEYAKRKELLSQSLLDFDTQLRELQEQRLEVVKAIEMIDAILGKNVSAKARDQAIREGMRRTRMLNAQQIEQARRVIEEQKQVIAEKLGAETAKAFVEQQQEKPVKHKKKAIVNGTD